VLTWAFETPFKAATRVWSRLLPEQKLPPVQANLPLGVVVDVASPTNAITHVNLTLLGGLGNLAMSAGVSGLPLVPTYSTSSYTAAAVQRIRSGLVQI